MARRFYDGPHDEATGEKLTIGGPQPGSELAWAGVYVPRAAAEPIYSGIIALDSMRNLIFEQDPPASFSLADVRFDKATFNRLAARHPLFDATNPDLSASAAAGGKLILWHGWSDPHISPLNTIAYHEAVQALAGKAKAERFERLYLLPGVYHCSGGEGPSLVDFLTPMLEWVEQGSAPQAVVTRQDTRKHDAVFGLPPPSAAKDGRRGPPPGAPALPDLGHPPAGLAANAFAVPETMAPRARPVYPYPAVASFDGKGDPAEATSYTAPSPVQPATSVEWAGSKFYQPYRPAEH